MIIDAEKIRALRKQSNKTLREMAISTGLTSQAILDLESGKSKNPHIGTIKAVADFYGVHLMELLIEETHA